MEELQERRGPGRPPKYTEAQVTPEVRERPKRKPFGSLEQKLAYPDRVGFHRHWFNDSKNRIARALEAGYTHVEDKDGKNVCYIVGTSESGGPLHAFLMEIPQEWYNEDMAAEQALIDEKESAIKRGKNEEKEG